MPARVARELGIFAFFTALAIVLTWPLATHLRTAVPDQGDPLLNMWIIDWVCHALTHAPLDLFDAPIFHPARLPLAYSENLIGIALVVLPLHLAGLSAVTVYNVAMILGFAHAAYGGYVLARVVSRSMFGSLIAGTFFGFVSFKFDHLSHIQIVWSGWIPLMLAALIVFWSRPTTGRAALLAAAFLMNGLTNIHYLLFGSVALLASVVVLSMVSPVRDRAFWIRLAGALAIGGILLLPVLLPYRLVADLYQMKRIANEVRSGSAQWDDWLRVTGRSWLYSKIGDPALARAERVLFPGLLVMFLTVAAALITPRSAAPALELRPRGESRRLLRTLDVLIVICAILSWLGAVAKNLRATYQGEVLLRFDSAALPFTIAIILVLVRLSIRFPSSLGGDDGRTLLTALRSSRFSGASWAAAIWIAIGVFGSFGMNAFFHRFLFDRVTVFQSIRAPGRWAVIAYVGLAVWAALGVREILARRSARGRAVVSAAIAAICLIEVWPSIWWEQLVPETPSVYRWLAFERVGPVVELPVNDNASAPFHYLLAATTHHVPLMNGTSGFEPPVHRELRTKYEKRELDAAFLDLIERNGARIIIVHGDRVSDHGEVLGRWIREALAADRIAVMRRHDNGISGDWVFVVKKNMPDWLRLRHPDRDAMGRSVEENLERFLTGQTTFNASIFGRLESPAYFEEVKGALQIKGWALSRSGVRSVDALIDGGAIRIPATLSARPDVTAAHPYYSSTATPGFSVEVPRRPKGVGKYTDVQIEITDGEGRVARLPDSLLIWR